MWKRVKVIYNDGTEEELRYRDFGDRDFDYIFYTDKGKVIIPANSVKKLVFEE